MSAVETTLEFIVKEEEQPLVASASIIGLPGADQAIEANMLTGPIKETVLAWFAQQGQYQRPDVTLADRLEIAGRSWDPERPRGTPLNLAG